MTFNNYPALEEAYANTCWENHRRDIDLIDKIIGNYNKMCEGLRKHKIRSVKE